MKTLIALILSFNLSAQIKWTDYDSHFHVSGVLTTGFSSTYYYFTQKKVLSVFFGISSSIFVSSLKEFIYDKHFNKGHYSNGDIDANGRGAITYGFFTFGSISDMEKQQQIDTLIYQNLNKK